jgi:hypothetical protein
MRVTAATLLVIFAAAPASRQPRQPFVPVGVIDDRPGASGQRTGLSELTKLRFTVVARRDPAADPPRHLRVDILPGIGLPPDVLSSAGGVGGLEIVTVREDSSASQVRRDAWVLIGRGFRGVLFDAWTALRKNPDALTGAASFADVVTRNAALFAPLSASSRAVGIDAAHDFFARFVESDQAMVLIAANLSDSVQQVTLKFAPDMPEAIWQNMESGAAVNFVAGPEGPIYTRTFTAHDVIVLMIRKQYK